MEEKNLKKLILEVESDTHKEIKVRAAERNISMRLWVLRAIAEAIRKEQQYE